MERLFLLNKNTNGVKSGIANVGELYENFLRFAGKKNWATVVFDAPASGKLIAEKAFKQRKNLLAAFIIKPCGHSGLGRCHCARPTFDRPS